MMTRRTILSMLGLGAASLLILSGPGQVPVAFAKSGSDGGGDASGGSKDATKEVQPQTGQDSTDNPGTEAQPADAVQCAAGTDCKKK